MDPDVRRNPGGCKQPWGVETAAGDFWEACIPGVSLTTHSEKPDNHPPSTTTAASDFSQSGYGVLMARGGQQQWNDKIISLYCRQCAGAQKS